MLNCSGCTSVRVFVFEINEDILKINSDTVLIKDGPMLSFGVLGLVLKLYDKDAVMVPFASLHCLYVDYCFPNYR